MRIIRCDRCGDEHEANKGSIAEAQIRVMRTPAMNDLRPPNNNIELDKELCANCLYQLHDLIKKFMQRPPTAGSLHDALSS